MGARYVVYDELLHKGMVGPDGQTQSGPIAAYTSAAKADEIVFALRKEFPNNHSFWTDVEWPIDEDVPYETLVEKIKKIDNEILHLHG